MARTLIDEIAVAGSFDPAAIFRGLQTGDAAIERFRTQSRPPLTITVTPDLSGFESALDRITGLEPVRIPVTLDPSVNLEQSLRALQERIRGLTVQSIAVPLDAGAAFRTLDQLQARLTRLGAGRAVDLEVRLRGAEEARRQAEQVSEAINPAAFDAFSQTITQQFQQISTELGTLNATLAQSLGGVTSFFQGFAQGAAEAVGEFSTQSATAAGATDDLAARSLLAAEAFRAQGVAEERLNATLERSGFLSEQAARGRLAEAAATRQAAADVNLLADRLRQVPALAGQSAQATRFMLDAFNESGRAAQRVRSGTDAMAEGIANVGRIQQGLPLVFNRTGESAQRAFNLASIGGGPLLNTLAGITVGAAGASGRLGTLSSNLLVLATRAAAGGLAAAGAIATVTALILAYERLTKGVREAREEQEKLLKSGRDALRQQDLSPEQNFGVPGDLREQAAAARGEILRLVREQRKVEGEINQAGLDNLNILVRQNELEEIRGKLAGARSKAERLTTLEAQARLEAEAEAIARVVQLQREATQTQTAFAASFAAALEAGLQIPQVAEQTSAHLAEQLAISRDITASNDQRVAALSAVNAIQVAQLAPLRRQLDLIRETTEADFERAQRLSQTPLDTTRPIPLSFDTGIEDLRELGRAVEDQVQQLDALRARYSETSTAAQVLTGQADGFRALGRQIEEAVAAADAAPVRLLSDAVTDLAQRLELVRSGSLGTLSTETPAVAATTRELVQSYVALTLEIERQGGPLRANAQSLQAIATAQRALGDSTAPVVQGLGLVAERLVEAEARLRDFRAETGEAFEPIQLEIEVELEAARRAVARFFDEILRRQRELSAQRLELLPAPSVSGITTGFDRAAADADQLADSMTASAAAANEFFREAEANAERARRATRDLRTEHERLNDAIHEVTRGLDLIVVGARNIGLIGDEAAAAVGAVQDLADSIGNVIEKASAGNILGLIGTGLNVLGSIGGALGIGQSPEEKAAEQASRELRVAIERLTREVGNVDFDISGNTFAGLEKVFGIITDPSKFLLQDNTKLGLRVERLLESFGLTIDDVKAAAAEMGLEFHNNAEFYRRFNEALKQTELTTFNKSFEGQLEKLFAGFDILGVTDPREQFEELARLASSPEFGAPAIADALRRFNVNLADGLNDPGEIERAREAFRDVFKNFESLTHEQIGALSPEQLLELLAKGTGLATDALDAFGESAADASKRLGDFNIPRGFRRAALAFEHGDTGIDRGDLGRELGDALIGPIRTLGGDGASLPLLGEILDTLVNQTDLGPVTEALAERAIPRLTDVLDEQEATLRELLDFLSHRGSAGLAGLQSPTTAAGGVGQPVVINIAPGAIVIHAAPGQNAEAIAGAVLQEFRRIAMTQSGDTLQIPVY